MAIWRQLTELSLVKGNDAAVATQVRLGRHALPKSSKSYMLMHLAHITIAGRFACVDRRRDIDAAMLLGCATVRCYYEMSQPTPLQF
jgi:hypothetical protein